MNKRVKILVLSIFLACTICFSGFSQYYYQENPPDLAELQEAVQSFSDQITRSLGFNSSLGLNWSDAYIGDFHPSTLKAWGAGGFIGASSMNLPIINTFADYFDFDIGINLAQFPIPIYAFEGRIGGFFLPFDVGFKFGYLPEFTIWTTDLDMQFLLIGGDIRYAVLNKDKPPKISVGVGVNYLEGSFGTNIGDVQRVSYYDEINYGYNAMRAAIITEPYVALKWSAVSLDFKVQVSKKFGIVTPYLGMGLSHTWAKSGYDLTTKEVIQVGNYNDTTQIASDIGDINNSDIAAIEDYLEKEQVSGATVTPYGISSMNDETAISIRVFGGVGFKLNPIVLDLTGLFNFYNSNYGASIAIRYQQ